MSEKRWVDKKPVLGDEVSYRPVTLWYLRGTVTEVRGNWAKVRWHSGIEVLEWRENLVPWRVNAA